MNYFNYTYKRMNFMKNLKNINWRILKNGNLTNISINVKSKSKNTRQNSKLISFFGFILLSIILIGTISSILYLPLYLRDYNLMISLLLIILLSIRYVFNEDHINNLAIKFFVDNSIFIIMPLVIVFVYVIILV